MKKRFTEREIIDVLKLLEDFGNSVKYREEEFFTVSKGEVEFHSEFYKPARLKPSDSVYLDSQMGHALICLSKDSAEILWISSTAIH